MKPLVIVTTFNRKAETKAMLESLANTTRLDEIELVIVDNHSTDGTLDCVAEWKFDHRRGTEISVLAYNTNKGCPRALNAAMFLRKAGQAVIKLDNDIRLLTPDWLAKVGRLVVEYEMEKLERVAMVSAYYEGVAQAQRTTRSAEWFCEGMLYRLFPVIGHAVYHCPAFMDQVGYFDVLTPGHLYGFEDLIMSHKAAQMRWVTLTWDGWQIENLQRHNSLGDEHDTHVAKMRPLYDARVGAIHSGGTLWTGPDGQPAERDANG